MFGQEYKPSKPKRLPTLSQFLKSLPKKTKVLEQVFQVELIWLPDKFDNVTLQTHAFRVILQEDHPLYADITSTFGLSEGFEDFPSFGVRVTNREAQSFQLEQMESKKGQWKALGASGRRFDS